jgi:uncharacterized protein YgiM (DUF1202 family)
MMPEFPITCRAIADYDSPYTGPFSLQKGEMVQVGRHDTEWPGWVWCTDAAGESRWVPEAYLRRDGEAGRMLRDYEATELPVKTGEAVTAWHMESGWLWCTNQAGQSGWVPLDKLQIGGE